MMIAVVVALSPWPVCTNKNRVLGCVHCTHKEVLHLGAMQSPGDLSLLLLLVMIMKEAFCVVFAAMQGIGM